MPKMGFTSITVSSAIYDHFHDIYLKNADRLQFEGITTFSGFITSILHSKMTEGHYRVLTLEIPKGGKQQ